jgi:hypothetical protein
LIADASRSAKFALDPDRGWQLHQPEYLTCTEYVSILRGFVFSMLGAILAVWHALTCRISCIPDVCGIQNFTYIHQETPEYLKLSICTFVDPRRGCPESRLGKVRLVGLQLCMFFSLDLHFLLFIAVCINSCGLRSYTASCALC